MVEYFTEADCNSTPFYSAITFGTDGNTAGNWGELKDIVVSPRQAIPALVSFVVNAGPTTDFVVGLDSLFFHRTDILFEDDFESGATEK